MHGSVQPEDRFPPTRTGDRIAGTDQSPAAGAVGAGGGRSDRSRSLEEKELDSALQLLVERAQYITGATGSALALAQGDEMICRASAGSSAPAVGARLQMRSGLSGESVSRRQLLRCDNAETDPRVNLEACRALGIASIVVLPLLRRDGGVRGLFELFSDHAYAFEERDLIALERMADLTLTALDLAEQRQNSAPAPAPRRQPEEPVESASASSAQQISAVPLHPEFNEPPSVPVEALVTSSLPASPATAAASVPESMLRVQKCSSCGFPVSEGRTLCLDCEKKDSDKKNFENKQREREQRQIEQEKLEQQKIGESVQEQGALSAPAATTEEFVPAFLANAAPLSESWLANHVNLLAIVVLILGILVAVVVFR